jgi:RNA polymerase sigma factor (sigma-70 family)
VGKRQGLSLDYAESISSDAKSPDSSAVCNEQLQMLNAALDQIPYEQREVVILYGRGQMRFKAIAKLQNVSIKTVQSRYRYGLDKLRIILDDR